jgi:hypothetical protein
MSDAVAGISKMKKELGVKVKVNREIQGTGVPKQMSEGLARKHFLNGLLMDQNHKMMLLNSRE